MPRPLPPPPLPFVPLESHLGHLDRVLVQERLRRLLVALQRRREDDEEALATLAG